MDLAPHHDTLRKLTRTDPDPRVRRRADGRDGLVDRRRDGRPPKLDAAASTMPIR